MFGKITKMFLGLLFGAILVLGFGQPAMADYHNPPDWGDNAYYTHQSWDFDAVNWPDLHCPPQEGDPDPIAPAIPLEPDARGDTWVNSYGTPYLIYALYPDDPYGEWSWYGMGGPWTRCGYYGGMGDTALVFEIPVPEDVEAATYNLPDNMKLSSKAKAMLAEKAEESKATEAWIQWTYYASAPLQGEGWAIDVGRGYEEYPEEPDPLDRIVITDTDGIEINVTRQDNVGGGGGTGVWYRATANVTFDDNPEMFYVKVYALTDGAATLIDEVDIDTRCGNGGPCFISTATYGSNVGTLFSLMLFALLTGVISLRYSWKQG
ncbi:MAG: hypothetical protein J7L53_03030 [Deltaproteobacteria bacterium]|nr:hypothetical protein [Deltaproteobacteria bacterium]